MLVQACAAAEAADQLPTFTTTPPLATQTPLPLMRDLPSAPTASSTPSLIPTTPLTSSLPLLGTLDEIDEFSAISPDGSMLAKAVWPFDDERNAIQVQLIDTTSEKELFTYWASFDEDWYGMVGLSDMAFSPDGSLLAVASVHEQIYFWDTETGALVDSVRVGGGIVSQIAFSPDGAWLAFTNYYHDAEILAADFGVVQVKPKIEYPVAAGGLNLIYDFEFSMDDRFLVTGGTVWFSEVGAAAQLWDYANCFGSISCEAKEGHILSYDVEYRPRAYDVALSPEGRWLATYSDQFGIHDRSSGNVLRWPTLLEFDVVDFTFSGHGVLVMRSRDNVLYLFEPGTGELLGHLSFGSGTDQDQWLNFALTADGARLFTASPNTPVQVWQMPTVEGSLEDDLVEELDVITLTPITPTPYRSPTATYTLQPPTATFTASVTPGPPVRLLRSFEVEGNILAYSPGGATIAVTCACITPQSIKILDAQSGRELQRLEKPLSDKSLQGLRDLAFSPDGQWLAAAGVEGIVFIWDLESGLVVHTHNVGSWIHNLTFSPWGEYLAFGGVATDSKSGLISIEGDILASLWPDRIIDFAFSPDGRMLASAHKEVGSSRGIHVWDLENCIARERVYCTELLAPFNIEAGSDPSSTSVTFSPDGSLLVGVMNYELRIWDLMTGTELNWPMSYRPHDLQLQKVAISSQGILAAGDRDCNINLLVPETGELLATIDFDDKGDDICYFDMAFSPNGTELAITNYSQPLTIWSVPGP
ncbi:MAG: hypothetical protein D8M60_05835 [Chloroflexi bacterium]|nr:hypothetical protein [Chloroflexota bacterium]